MSCYTARALGKKLVDLGVLPQNCANAELLIPIDGVLKLRCEFLVTDKDIPKIQQALGELLESSKANP